MSKLKNMKMANLLYVIMGIVLLELIVVGVIGGNLMQRNAETGSGLYQNYGRTRSNVSMGYACFQDIKVSFRNVLYVYADDSEKQAEARNSLSTSEKILKEYFSAAEKDILEADAVKLMEETLEQIDMYYDDVERCLNYLDSGKRDEAVKYFQDNCINTADVTAAKVMELMSLLDDYATQAESRLQKTNRQGLIVIVVLIIIGVLTCWNNIRLLTKRILEPIKEITKVAQSVSRGEVEHDIQKSEKTNEIGILCNSMHQMVQTLKTQASVLTELAEGNFNVTIQPHSEKDVTGMAIRKLIADDNRVFGVIRNATGQISLGSSQIATASQTLAQGSTQQASSIQQILASITDIANKTKENAEQAGEVSRIVMEAKTDVAAGNQRMKEMVAAMQEINEASENIQKIIKVIDDIAFNTNILALNATVEAARAGEQGKGFAVVAEEVRNLAGRSAEASSQTAEMIEDSIQKVRKGSELAVETEKALELVSNMIEQITGLSKEIADASNVQASATAQIDQALSQVSQVVQTNSATSQQCASASEQLSGQARGLETELAKFKLRDVVGDMPSQTLEYEQPMMLEDGTRY